jgi:hypothetical protein
VIAVVRYKFQDTSRERKGCKSLYIGETEKRQTEIVRGEKGEREREREKE